MVASPFTDFALQACSKCMQEHQNTVAEAMELVEFRAGQAIYKAGDAGDR